MNSDDAIHPVREGDVQYPFADVGGPELLYIETLYAMKHRRREFSYTCPYCKKEMRPYLGEHNRHCFAHKPGQSCDRDKYIHTTAEQLLKERWDSDGPFEFTLTVEFVCEKADTCVFAGVVDGKCRRRAIHTINLKERYSTCLVEKKVGEFIPDLCLVDESGTNKPLFLEIWNTSRNSDKKNSSEVSYHCVPGAVDAGSGAIGRGAVAGIRFGLRLRFGHGRPVRVLPRLYDEAAGAASHKGKLGRERCL